MLALALLECGITGSYCAVVLGLSGKFNQILALALLKSWSGCAVVSRLVLLYNLTKFWLQLAVNDNV